MEFHRSSQSQSNSSYIEVSYGAHGKENIQIPLIPSSQMKSCQTIENIVSLYLELKYLKWNLCSLWHEIVKHKHVSLNRENLLGGN